MTIVLLNSDNFENQLVTVEAYEELVLQMSTGDFHTHKAELVIKPESFINWDVVVTLEQINEEL